MAPIRACALGALLLSAVPGVVACGDAMHVVYEDGAVVDEDSRVDGIKSYEEFEAQSLYGAADPEPVYLVEGDILVNKRQLIGSAQNLAGRCPVPNETAVRAQCRVLQSTKGRRCRV